MSSFLDGLSKIQHCGSSSGCLLDWAFALELLCITRFSPGDVVLRGSAEQQGPPVPLFRSTTQRAKKQHAPEGSSPPAEKRHRGAAFGKMVFCARCKASSEEILGRK